MICLIQRAQYGRVTVAGETIAETGPGMVVLVGFERGDDESILERMAHKLLHYRLFGDENDRMNLNVQEAGGEILLVPQFTLAANTRKGLRPNFTPAAAPDQAEKLFERFVTCVRQRTSQKVEQGQFGAHMQVSLSNDGPVTFWLQMAPDA